MTEATSNILIECNDSMWVDIMDALSSVTNATAIVLSAKMKSLGVIDKEIESQSVIMKYRSWLLLLEIIHADMAEAPLMEKLRTKFESQFRYDEQGLPRMWKPADQIDILFAKAKGEVYSGLI